MIRIRKGELIIMKVTYIHHSCFVWEGKNTMIVYDYWRDTPHGKLHNILSSTGKQIYFVNSHFHEDHFSRDVLTWDRNKRTPPRLLLSHDIVKRRRVDKELPSAIMRPGDHYEDEYILLDVYRSTDVGVSTLITLKDDSHESCFHAGDLNNWYFPEGDERLHILVHEMEGLYLSTLRDIQLDHPHVTHAMLPLDPRLGLEQLRGPSQWLARIETSHFYPMHTWGRHEQAQEQIEQLAYLFPRTQFHYEADPESMRIYGDFFEVVREQIELAESGQLFAPREKTSGQESEASGSEAPDIES